MNLLQLRTDLETLLTPVLGTYTLPNGSATPAISVRSSGEALPANTRVSGLEAVLIRDPDLTPIRQYNTPNSLRTWTLFLVDWSELVNLEPIGAFLVRTYPNAEVSTVAVPRTGGPQNQMRVLLPFSAPPVTELVGTGVYAPSIYEPGVFQ